MSEFTTQFKQVKTVSGRVAFESWTAVLRDNVQVPGTEFCETHEMAFSAPTLAALEKMWNKFSVVPFSREAAQHTYIVKFEDRSDKSL